MYLHIPLRLLSFALSFFLLSFSFPSLVSCLSLSVLSFSLSLSSLCLSSLLSPLSSLLSFFWHVWFHHKEACEVVCRVGSHVPWCDAPQKIFANCSRKFRISSSSEEVKQLCRRTAPAGCPLSSPQSESEEPVAASPQACRQPCRRIDSAGSRRARSPG